MDSTEITLSEKGMKHFIEDLLCLENKGSWSYTGTDFSVKIKFKGNIYKVQKGIYEWLKVPPRRRNFELFAYKSTSSLPKYGG